MRTGGYANDLANVGIILTAIGWDPRDEFTYAISASDGSRYDLTSTHPDGWTICVRYPERVACP